MRHTHNICSQSGKSGSYGNQDWICRSIGQDDYGVGSTGYQIQDRQGTVTRGKRKAVKFIIKVL